MTLNRLLARCALVFLLGGSIACAARISGAPFTEENMRNVTVGMTAKEVYDLLGKPYAVETYIGGEKWIWSYSDPDLDISFVVSIEKGKVRSFSGFREYKR